MSGYRDDREARQAQLEALKREVADVSARLGEDRERLADLEARIATLTGDGPPPPTPAAQSAAPNAVRRLPLLLGLGAAMVVGVFLVGRTGPSPVPPTPSPLADIPGAPHAVDPLALLPRAWKLAPPAAELTGISLRYVAPDGTIDLQAAPGHGTGSATFTFVVTPPPRHIDPSAPLGAPKPEGEPYRGAEVHLDNRGLRAESESGGNGTWMVFRLPTDPLPEPRCSTRRIWEVAIAAGAPSHAIAHLTYGRGFLHKQPVWKFSIDDTRYEYTIADPECRVLTAAEELHR